MKVEWKRAVINGGKPFLKAFEGDCSKMRINLKWKCIKDNQSINCFENSVSKMDKAREYKVN